MSTHQPPMPQAPQAAPDWQAAPGGPYPGYTSPIPVVRTNLGHAITSEWTKIRSVRSTMWTLGVFVLLVVGIGLLAAAIVSGSSTEDLGDQNALSLGFFGLLLGCICIITLGVLTTASEYGTGMIRTTMVACPSRVRVLAAKSIVFFAVAFVITLATSSFVAMTQVSMLGQSARTPTGGEWLKATVGVSLYIALLGLLSLLVGSVIRHSAGAITIMIGAVLAPLVIALFMFSSQLEKVRTALFEYSIPNQMSIFYSNSLGDGGPSGWDPLWIVLGATAVAFAGACALLEKRDV
ncbi:ABC transporter permease subunit [Streptomyces sp. NPDC059467]|uniref:ABC transporter permease subunit n=1 Tax=Streptomyces sp. NPDC059467 TaxID=3346844 RepID=UPI0036743D9A